MTQEPEMSKTAVLTIPANKHTTINTYTFEPIILARETLEEEQMGNVVVEVGCSQYLGTSPKRKTTKKMKMKRKSKKVEMEPEID